MEPIAYIENDFSDKFGIPRQGGLTSLPSIVRFTPPYRNADALRGIEGFSHLWLLWDFSEAHRDTWSPTVRPPRLGGNQRVGVFATRSPYRPNSIGLTAVRLDEVVLKGKDTPYLVVTGADLLSGTPIWDIKPYLPQTDSIPDARGGFAEATADYHVQVYFPPELLARVPERLQAGLMEILSQDPRPSYQHDPTRIYGFTFGNMEVRFTVDGDTLTVVDVLSCT